MQFQNARVSYVRSGDLIKFYKFAGHGQTMQPIVGRVRSVEQFESFQKDENGNYVRDEKGRPITEEVFVLRVRDLEKNHHTLTRGPGDTIQYYRRPKQVAAT